MLAPTQPGALTENDKKPAKELRDRFPKLGVLRPLPNRSPRYLLPAAKNLRRDPRSSELHSC